MGWVGRLAIGGGVGVGLAGRGGVDAALCSVEQAVLNRVRQATDTANNLALLHLFSTQLQNRMLYTSNYKSSSVQNRNSPHMPGG